MPELSFQVRGAEAVSDAALPAIALQLEISNQPADESIQTVVLRCQIQIEAPRRQYGELEKQKLRDIFAEPERWRQRANTASRREEGVGLSVILSNMLIYGRITNGVRWR